ncbi:MAG: T9SS type A sorting domain-containing protein [Bacteroidetes bacterium]|nr:T9SS type A sorting domain-containing protein [Bacteroidota bacterium]
MKSISISIILFFGVAYQSIAQQIIDGYTDKLSYHANDVVTFYISASVPQWCDPDCIMDLHLYDITGSDIGITIPSVDVRHQTQQTNAPWKNGFGYQPSAAQWTVPAALKSGFYLLGGISSGGGVFPIIIKGADYPSMADIVVVCPTNTINAYTCSGGRSLYNYYCPSTAPPATTVSFLRPQDYSQGRMDGFLQWMESTSYFTDHNLSLNVISDLDMDDWDEIKNAKLLIVIGHSEYWSRQARINFDRFVDEGNGVSGHNHDALILSGNSMWWQVRYSDDNLINDCLPAPDKTIMTCHKHDGVPADPYGSDDLIGDPLLKTYNWIVPSLKYSILGSIGSDLSHGGAGIEATQVVPGLGICAYGDAVVDGEYYGYKIISQSPLLNGTYVSPAINNGDIIKLAHHEMDGTLITNTDDVINNGADPIIDVAALGFYKAELIGFEKTRYPRNNFWQDITTNFCPFMVFKKTCGSGRIVNVNADNWCGINGMGGATFDPNDDPCPHITPDSRLTAITQNMVAKLLTGNDADVFSDPTPPPLFSIKPSFSTVSYSACMTDGLINFSKCGVTLTNAYKVDNGSRVLNPSNGLYEMQQNHNLFSAKIENCTSCTRSYARMAATAPHTSDTATASEEKASLLIKDSKNNFKDVVDISPNPNEGRFTLQLKEQSDAGTSEAFIYNPLGQLIFQSSIINNQSSIDLSAQPKGIYFVKVQSADKVYTEKVVVH